MAKITDLGAIFANQPTFGGLSELEGSRGNDIGECYIDITKRDAENGVFNIDITIYVRPDVPINRVMPALQRTCIDIFGNEPGDNIDLFYHPGQLKNGQAVGIEVNGMPGVFQSFGVTIKHPMSTFFNLDRLKNTFISTSYKHLEIIR